MRKFISTIPATTVLTGFVTAVNTAIAPFTPFKINLTNKERKGRSMAEDREGYARLVSRIANQFPNSLSRADSPTELVALINYYEGLEADRLALTQAIEIIQEIQLGASMDAMVLVDRYVKNLQISRSNDGSLDTALKEVDEWNKRFGGSDNKTTSA
jgi:hypothetical protein